MAPIQSYVFIDLETTGLPVRESYQTKITELSIVIVKRRHILDTVPGTLPRVQHKLTLCFNPGRMIDPEASQVSGLDNDLLEFETMFDIHAFNTIKEFLTCQEKPLCLIAHNGFNFDFPILKSRFEMLNAHLDADVMCADSLNGFYDILREGPNFQVAMPNVVPKRITEIRRRFFYGNNQRPNQSFSLIDIYERVLGRPAIEPHRAANDCVMIAQIAIARTREFVAWIDNNHCPFSEVTAMSPDVQLGFLVLTGLFWGCTNPFIRQGTKGLRDVTATTRLGQAWAEITFLLGNWKYVLPWLVNQAGSLVYLAAVRRAPLSVAVPTANSLAFAFTAITGATVGAEEPLDRWSVLGIVLIMGGTALCCYDKTS
ncbi:unnamed protein product [Arctia plantaginis]|uniref:Exonuclease domain-containing protein n=1 Tax=Arctia plantaginis TaxID=874455 RepID=A0A8S1APQ2_ARCPL|nr:unnamed protein product [Arctia plantaginis]CAB3246601.1 unnamed protein product [Arctia plantaginis]